MSKNELREYIILAVIFTVFSVTAFAAPFERNTVFWFSYVFGVIAIVFQVYVFRIAFADGGDTKSKFYGFSIARVGVIYLVVQLGLSLIQMIAANHLKSWVSIIINILPIAFAVIGTVAADAVRDEVERQEEQVKTDVSMMKYLNTSVAALENLCQNDDIKKKIVKLTEEFRYSDPVSNEETVAAELELKDRIDDLQRVLIDGDANEAEKLCKVIMVKLTERNESAKNSK